MYIATVQEYAAMLSKTLSTAEQASATTMLAQATDIIERYCDRVFASATYSEWVDQSLIWDSKNVVFVRNYPITKVYYIGTPSVVGSITYAGSGTQSSASWDGTSLTLFRVDPSTGLDVITEITSPKVMSALKTAVDAAGWSMTIDAAYASYPVSQLAQFVATQTGGGNKVNLMLPIATGITATIDKDENSNFLITNTCSDSVFVKYVAGYTSYPSDLKLVCIHLANDLLSYGKMTDTTLTGNGVSNSMLQSESINDYSYTKRSGTTSVNGSVSNTVASVENIVLKYSDILSRYVRKYV